jgi:uncharacterized membrane protein YraQ (UPF0718 family)
VLPAAASLQKQGANKGATTAFLISTPESGVDSIAITYALLDPIMTVVRPIAAFVTAIAAGLLENSLNWKEPENQVKTSRACGVDGCCDGTDCPEEEHKNHHTLREKIVAGFRYSVTDVWGDIAVWFYIGLLIAAVITVMIPDALMVSLLGGGFSSMLIMLLIGIPLYICATASTPVAAALILKGVSPGAALVFLLVGPATNITSLSVLFGVLGKKSTFRYLAVLSTAAVIFGLAVDQLYAMLNISPQAIIGEAAEIIPVPVKFLAVLILVIFSVKPLFAQLRRIFRKKEAQTQFIARFPEMPAQRSGLNIPQAGHSSGCGCGSHDSAAQK